MSNMSCSSEALGPYMKARGVLEVIQVGEPSSVDTGTVNMMGALDRIVLGFTDAEGLTRKKSVVVKKAKSHYIITSCKEEGWDFFRTEIIAYSEILPKIERLLTDGGKKTFWPECLGFVKYEELIFEDLKESGFKPAVRIAPGLDVDHALIAIRGLAEFHAASVVLIKSGQIDTSSFPSTTFSGRLTIFNKIISMSIGAIIKYGKLVWPKESQHYIPVLEKMSSLFEGELKRLFDRTDTRWLVINHGDCWLMNILYKYDELNRPTSMMLVDFQALNYNTFAADVTHLLYSSLTPETRQLHYRHLMAAYHDRLSQTFRDVGWPEGDVPTLARLEQEVEDFRFVGLVASVVTVPVAMASGNVRTPSNGDTLAARSSSVEDRIKDPKYMSLVLEVLKEFEADGFLRKLKLLD